MLSAYKALFLDLSGVLYIGSEPVAGVQAFLKQARDSGLMLRFLTNTASKSSAMVLDGLRVMGIEVAPDELFTAPLAAKAYLKATGLRPKCIIHENLTEDFADIAQDNPNAVLLGDARQGLNYDALNQAFSLCMQGAPLLGIGMNKYFKDDDGFKLDAGPFIHALEWAAGISATIMGKPSTAFFDQVVASTPFSAEQCLMVGDDIDGDVIGAYEAGLQACLVRTGKYRAQDEKRLPEKARVIDSIVDLLRNS